MQDKEDSWIFVGKNNVEFVLPPSMIFLGREECDVVLVSQSVDKRHAVITYDHYLHQFKVKDLNSANGTYVNNVRIAEQTYVKLNHMDTLRFGYDSCVYYIKEPLTIKKSSKDAADHNKPRILSPVKSPTASPTPSNSSSNCQGCIQEKLISQQLSPTVSSSGNASPVLDGELHITEENLSTNVNDLSAPSHTTKNNSYLNSSNNDKGDNISSANDIEDVNLDSSSSATTTKELQSTVSQISEKLNNVPSISSTAPSIVEVQQSSFESHVPFVSTYAPNMNPSNQSIPQPMHGPSQLMSASYPSSGYNVLAAQHHPTTVMTHPVAPSAYQYVNPMNCYQTQSYYQAPPYQTGHSIDPAVLQSTPDLTNYGNMYHHNIQPVSNNPTWTPRPPDPTNIEPVFGAPQSILSNISGDSLEYTGSTAHNSNIKGNAVPPAVAAASSTPDTPGGNNVEGQITQLYGQPAWWGESEASSSRPTFGTIPAKSGSQPQGASNSALPPTSTPVATAFTIDFDAPKASAPNKKMAIKDRISKYAPPKSGGDESRGHRRSSSQSITTDDESSIKEEVRKPTKSASKTVAATKPLGNSSKTIRPNQNSNASNSDSSSRSKQDSSKKQDLTNKVLGSKNKSEAVIPQSHGVLPSNSSSTFLIEKMFNSFSDNQQMVQPRMGRSTDDRIRRKTIILSPKEETANADKSPKLLSPSVECNEFPDDVSETGTYILEADKPEAKAKKNKLDQKAGFCNGGTKAGSAKPASDISSDTTASQNTNITKKNNETLPPIVPPRNRPKGETQISGLKLNPGLQETPRHRRKLPTPPVDQPPLNIKAAFSPKISDRHQQRSSFDSNHSSVHNGTNLGCDTKKILKETENVVTAMQARIKSSTLGHSSPMLVQMNGLSSSDSEVDVSSASLVSDSALLNRRKNLSKPAKKKVYTSDDGSRHVRSPNHRQPLHSRPYPASLQTFKVERPNSVHSNSSESSDSSRRKKSPNDLSLKVNRAFELRKARAEDDHTPVKAPTKSRPGSASSSRSIHSSASSNRVTPESFNRSDGGRFSLRVKSAPPARQKGPSKKELEMAAWTRRKAYNPLKAAAQDRKKLSLSITTDDSFYTDDEITNPLPSASSSGVPENAASQKQGSHHLEALDLLVISSIHQLSFKLRARLQDVLTNARKNSAEETERLKLEETINQMNLAESPLGNSTRELSSTLKNLKRIELGLEALSEANCIRSVPNKDQEYY